MLRDNETDQVAEPARGAAPQLAAPESSRMVELQRTVGNRALSRLIDGSRTRRLARTAAAPTLLAALPIAQRRNLREVTDQIGSVDLANAVMTPPGATIPPGGARMSHQTPAGTQFAPTIPAALQPVLGAVAGWMLGNTAWIADSTTALSLDLTPYGGGQGTWRFTRSTPGGTQQILVDEIAPTGAVAAAPATNAKFDRHSMVVRGTPPADFTAAVRQAAEQFPDSLLSGIDGLAFELGTASGMSTTARPEGGHYDPNTHTVTITPVGRTATIARFGDQAGTGSDATLRTILHEIAHAIDSAPVRSAQAAETVANTALSTWLQANGTPNARGDYDIPNSKMAAYNRLRSAADRASAAATAAHSLSGADATGNDDAAASNAFTAALTASGGTDVTVYPATRAGENAQRLENFADLYSLFILEPETLKAMRPEIHTYFTSLGAGRVSASSGQTVGAARRRP